MRYCYECSQVLIAVYLPSDKEVALMQPAGYCLNRECKMMGIVTVLTEAKVDELKPNTSVSEDEVNTSEVVDTKEKSE